ncbi:LAFE_0D01090g1_1 [Lachancea fermentati]|uniref:LAFE_0D01090g1_1 n=1 Tax=Lachancea fermentati TaxID=4955 RepID=A0A1G4MAM0_LACFM|nr:LAFE_0D01090g1_1 [Lachancea fermentati]
MESIRKVLEVDCSDSNMSISSDSDLNVGRPASSMIVMERATADQHMREPLPTNKEERIQLALKFLKRQEEGAEVVDNGAKPAKHSLRQIALYFQVPKSTLYDRLKCKTNNTSKAHAQQMKLAPQVETQFLHKLRLLCQSHGNIPTLIQMKNVIESSIDNVSLGKKWIHNFVKRHQDFVIYGSDSSNITLGNFKSYKSNYEYLWKCFVPVLQERITQQRSSFYYITRTALDNGSMSSVFNCFKINPNFTIEVKAPPQAVIFNSDTTDKSTKIAQLNKILLSLYTQCESLSPFVIFEGFDDTYHWDLTECDTYVDVTKFLALPWGQEVFHRELFLEFQSKFKTATQGCHLLQLPLGECNFKLSQMMQNFIAVLRSQMSIDTSGDLRKSGSSIALSTSTNVFEGGTTAQLQSIIELIDQYEAQLYRDVLDPSSKVILNDIFTRLRNAVPQ